VSDVTLWVPRNDTVAVILCSPPSWAAQIVLEEKRAPYELRELSFEANEHRTPEMLAKNPRGTVPVLEHDGVVVHETFAILEYLNFVFGDPGLLPVDRIPRARTLVRFHESAALKTTGMALFAYLMRTVDGGREPTLLRTMGQAFDDEVARWETYAIAGDLPTEEPSLASIVVFVYLATAAQLGYALPPALAQFVAGMRSRRAVTATWPNTWTATPPAAPPWHQDESVRP
jgi:glutathione S-transferase